MAKFSDHFEPEAVAEVLARLYQPDEPGNFPPQTLAGLSIAISLKRIADELCGGVRRPYETTERASLTDILSCAADRMHSQ